MIHAKADSISFPAMDILPGGAGIGLLVAVSILVQLAWHIAVIVFLYVIWKKVKHLPS